MIIINRVAGLLLLGDTVTFHKWTFWSSIKGFYFTLVADCHVIFALSLTVIIITVHRCTFSRSVIIRLVILHFGMKFNTKSSSALVFLHFFSNYTISLNKN